MGALFSETRHDSIRQLKHSRELKCREECGDIGEVQQRSIGQLYTAPEIKAPKVAKIRDNGLDESVVCLRAVDKLERPQALSVAPHLIRYVNIVPVRCTPTQFVLAGNFCSEPARQRCSTAPVAGHTWIGNPTR